MVIARVLVAALVSSCSWSNVTPPHAPPSSPGDCTRDYDSPVTDTVVASIGAGLIVGSAIAASRCGRGDFEAACEAAVGTGVITGAMFAIAFGLSAVAGYSEVSRCRAALRDAK